MTCATLKNRLEQEIVWMSKVAATVKQIIFKWISIWIFWNPMVSKLKEKDVLLQANEEKKQW